MSRKNIFDNFGSSSSSDDEKTDNRKKRSGGRGFISTKDVKAPPKLRSGQPPQEIPPPPPPPKRRKERFEEEDNFEIVRREEDFYASKEEDVFDDRGLEEFSDLTERKKVFKKDIGLAPVDHKKINYKKIIKEVWKSPQSEAENVIQKRNELGVHVSGFQSNQIPPISAFSNVSHNESFLNSLRMNRFENPTPIQAQVIPYSLGGRDIIGISQTGSGKTLAFIVPSFLHFFGQTRMVKKASPIILVLAPTRELSIQIFRVFRSISKHLSRKVGIVLLVGGVDKNAQFKELRKGSCDFVIGTPGRVIDLYKMKAFFVQDVTMVILDEVDRMFEMGFEKQVKSILSQIRLDRQTLCFSATLHPRVQHLVQDTMVDAIEVRTVLPNPNQQAGPSQGGSQLVHPLLRSINPRIQQKVILVNSEEEKFRVLQDIHLPFYLTFGSILIFVKSRVRTEDISTKLCELGFISSSLHGEKNVEEREEVLLAFRNKVVRILVSTDVASRGLDIPNIQTVINYDIPKNLETYIHRIGRTGRELTNQRHSSSMEHISLNPSIQNINNNNNNNKKKKKRRKKKKGFSKKMYDGNAVTFMDRRKEAYFAPNLVNVLETVVQDVSMELLQIAMKNPKFRKHHQMNHRNQSGNMNIKSSSSSNVKSTSNTTVARPPPPPPPTSSSGDRSGISNMEMRYYSGQQHGGRNEVESEFVKHVRRQYQHSFVYSNTQYFDDTEEIEVIPPILEQSQKEKTKY